MTPANRCFLLLCSRSIGTIFQKLSISLAELNTASKGNDINERQDEYAKFH